MVNRSKNIEINEMIKPEIINGLDLTFSSSLLLFLGDTRMVSFFERRLAKGLIIIKSRFKLITLKF